MKYKKFIFIFILLFFILFLNNNCFAINITVDGSTVELPDFTPNPHYGNGEYYFIMKGNNNANYTLYSLDSPGGIVYYQQADDRLQIKNFSIYKYTPNSDTQWVYQTGLSGPVNLYLSGNSLLFSNFDILYENSDNVYFADSTKIPEPEPEVLGGIDTLYIGDIPEEYCYAQFSSDYVTLFNQSSANNEDLNYYRIYFIDNGFYYEKGVIHFSENVSFQKINVSNKFYYRRDFVSICLTTFVIIIFFLWITNFFITTI